MVCQPEVKRPTKNKYYYSDNVYQQTGFGMWYSNGDERGNCTAYAWGRFYEIIGSTPESGGLPNANAGQWIGMETGYIHKKANENPEPQLGAVICWSKSGKAGHVAIVEEIKSDGKIVISQSGWEGPFFDIQTVSPPHYYPWNDDAYTFQGFIYNPSGGGTGSPVTQTVDTIITDFVSYAEGYIGKGHPFTKKTTGIAHNASWSAAFVSACVHECTDINKVIPCKKNNQFITSPSDIASVGVNKSMGVWKMGPAEGKASTPEVGDIAFLRLKDVVRTNKYSSDACGIVCEVTDKKVKIIQGNADDTNKVDKKKYNITSKLICGYYRPNWYFISPRYNIREVAMAREIGYLTLETKKKKQIYKPSISTTSIRLAVMNYITPLEENTTADSGAYDPGNLKGVPKAIYTCLTTNHKMSSAVAIGIIGNIEHECSFDISQEGDDGGAIASGMCQWRGSRSTDMKNFVGADWKTDLSGQCDYMVHELESSDYSSYYNDMKAQPNTIQGAGEVALIFARHFEVCAGRYGQEGEDRKASAEKFWKQLVNTN